MGFGPGDPGLMREDLELDFGAVVEEVVSKAFTVVSRAKVSVTV